MSMKPTVTDLSHWNGAIDFAKVKAAGIQGVINKATEGTSVVDKTYASRRKAAAKAGLLWGAYHFANSSPVTAQVEHFLKVAAPDSNTLLALDWEPNRGSTMSLDQAKEFLRLVYEKTGQRPVLYSGNLIKEVLGERADPFLSKHRLWLAQYGPKAKLPPGFSDYWLWQYTGDGIGNEPHSLDGVTSKVCDLNVFGGKDLAKEWCTGGAKVAAPAVTAVVIPAADKPKKMPPIVREAPKGYLPAAKESPSTGLGIGSLLLLWLGYVGDWFGQVFGYATSFLDSAPDMVSGISSHVSASQQMTEWLGIEWKTVSAGFVSVFILIMIIRNLRNTRWFERKSPGEIKAQGGTS
jgi:GH25 family lysozyme M1 (1,4-beta-N-acetylmuramidase)